MPRKPKKYHFIYKTTNLVNNKFYVGMHSTDNLEDGYVGSGKRLGYSIRKYGLENHKFEILEFLPSREELKKREAEVVNEELLGHPLCMNLKFGGEGGWEFVNSSMTNEERKARQKRGAEKANQSMNEDPILRCQRIERNSKGMRQKQAEGKIRHDTFTGRSHSEEAKEKMRKPKNVGEANSQFGTCWICNGDEAKKIKKEELQSWIAKGWSKGRKLPS